VRGTVIWVAAVVAALVLAAAARADVYDDNPAAASRGFNDLSVFARGADGSVLERHWTGSAWSSWASLGGGATSGPAAAAYGSAINVFIRGGDGAIYQNAFSNGAWTGWKSLGGGASSAPSAVWRRGPLNYFDIAVKGTDNAIYLNTYVPGSGWAGWNSLGGNFTSAPALNSQSDGVVNVFVRGTDGAVWQRSWNGSAWSDWVSLGGYTIGAPSVVSRGPNQLDLYARGGDSSIFQRHWDSVNGWTGWAQVDATPLDSSVALLSDNEGREILYARSGSELIEKTWLATSGWSAWTDFGAVAVPAPAPPLATPAPSGSLSLETGLDCTPPGGRLRVHITIRKRKGEARARVSKVVFFTRGKGHATLVDHKSPFTVHIRVNGPAGAARRVYARVHYRRSAHGKLHQKTVSQRYTVCR
jgi:hypothetical protein